MDEIDKTNLSYQTKFRLDKIKNIEDYFNSEINQRKLCSKKLWKYVTTFNYIEKILILLNVTTGGVFFKFSLATRMIKKILKTKRKQKRKNMIKFLCWLKVNSIASKL